MEPRYDFNLPCTAVSDFVEGIYSVNVCTNQIVLSLKSVVYQILKLFHFNLYNYLIYGFVALLLLSVLLLFLKLLQLLLKLCEFDTLL